MKVTIKVPEELINKDSKTKREYFIARSHNGKVDILETKYNEKTNSLTFETDKFSDYAILYKDTKEKEAVKVETTNKETVKSESKKEVKKVKTGDNANIIGLMMLLVSSMFVMVFVRKKKINREIEKVFKSMLKGFFVVFNFKYLTTLFKTERPFLTNTKYAKIFICY